MSCKCRSEPGNEIKRVLKKGFEGEQEQGLRNKQVSV